MIHALERRMRAGEVVREIPDFPGYFITNLGVVYSTKFNRVKELAQRNHGDGYKLVNIYKNSRQYGKTIHSLLAECFIGPRPEGMQVAHLNGDSSDNSLENLAYVTPKENQRHRIVHGTSNRGMKNGCSKLSSVDVRCMRVLYEAGIQQAKLKNIWGITSSAVSQIVNRKSWSHIE